LENNNPKILIVDDEKGIRTGTKRLLESEGYTVTTAENGTQGIEYGTGEDYDIAIIDLKMPDHDGIEVLKKIKEKYPNTICLIATAYASYDTAIESTRLGAYSYIPKPFTPDDMIHQVNKGYEQRRLLLESERLKKEREERLLELSHEKSRLNAIINSITEGVIVVNKTGELVYYNSAVLKNLNLDELHIGEDITQKVPQKVTDLVSKYLKSDKFIQTSYSTQIEIKPKSELVVEAICSPVTHPDGSFAGVVIVIRDITELKKIELVKSQFVSMVAHELKTPISAVIGFLKIILDPNISVTYEKQQDYLSRSVVRLSGLTDLVNDLLNISRMELKTKQREIQPLDIKEVINSTVEFLQFETKKKSIEIDTNFEEPLPELKADQNEINRLITNLLSNAIKYNKDKGTVKINVSTSKHYLVVEISDTGIGMKEEEKNQLFNEFFRAKNENTRGISGTGLGLAIVKRIVESYSGKIEVESEYGKGSTFRVFLPINK
jgi:PAS domain S-box-containing protein